MDTAVICTNEIKGNRYTIVQCPEIDQYVEEGKVILRNYVERNIKDIR
jgi:hypothetical protein